MRHQRLLQQQEAEDLAPPGDEAALRLRAQQHMQRTHRFQQHVLAFVLTVMVTALLFFVTDTDGAPLWWIPAIIAGAWGPSVVIHGVETWFATGARAARRTARVQQALRDAYGPAWYRDAPLDEQRMVRARVIGPQERRIAVARHGLVFVMVNAMLWLLWALLTPMAPPWPLFVSVPWALALAVGWISGAREGSESALTREIERQRALMEQAGWSDEKPKNEALAAEEPTLTVGPDGELVELADEDDAPLDKRKHG